MMQEEYIPQLVAKKQNASREENSDSKSCPEHQDTADPEVHWWELLSRDNGSWVLQHMGKDIKKRERKKGHLTSQLCAVNFELVSSHSKSLQPLIQSLSKNIY
jgi:hypothetical protein